MNNSTSVNSERTCNQSPVGETQQDLAAIEQVYRTYDSSLALKTVEFNRKLIDTVFSPSGYAQVRRAALIFLEKEKQIIRHVDSFEYEQKVDDLIHKTLESMIDNRTYSDDNLYFMLSEDIIELFKTEMHKMLRAERSARSERRCQVLSPSQWTSITIHTETDDDSKEELYLTDIFQVEKGDGLDYLFSDINYTLEQCKHKCGPNGIPYVLMMCYMSMFELCGVYKLTSKTDKGDFYNELLRSMLGLKPNEMKAICMSIYKDSALKEALIFCLEKPKEFLEASKKFIRCSVYFTAFQQNLADFIKSNDV